MFCHLLNVGAFRVKYFASVLYFMSSACLCCLQLIGPHSQPSGVIGVGFYHSSHCWGCIQNKYASYVQDGTHNLTFTVQGILPFITVNDFSKFQTVQFKGKYQQLLKGSNQFCKGSQLNCTKSFVSVMYRKNKLRVFKRFWCLKVQKNYCNIRRECDRICSRTLKLLKILSLKFVLL